MKKPKLPNYVPWLYRNMKKRIPLILLLTLFTVLNSYLTVQYSLSSKEVINGAISGDMDVFLRACYIYAAFVLANILLKRAMAYVSSYTLLCLNHDFKRSMLRKILRCEYSVVSRYPVGDIIQRMGTDAATAYNGVLTIITGLCGTISLLITSVVALMEIAPQFTVILVIAASIIGLFVLLIKDKLKQLQKEASASGGKVSGFLYESLYQLMMVQALDVSEEMMHRAEKVLEHSAEVQRRQRRMSLFTGLGSSALIQGTGFIAMMWGSWELFHGRLTFGDLNALVALVSNARASITSIPSVIPQLISISAACERIMEIETIPDQPTPEHTDRELLYDSMTGFRAEHLTFAYDRDPVMTDVSLTIPKGGLTVIVGPSGIGKSTLLKLLLGLYRPNSGVLSIETEEGSIHVSRAARTLFSYAPQGNFLLSGTLRENLTLTNPDATDEEIQHALYVSCMEEYVATLPDGLDTLLRENGAGLSEGQAQRLSLARAIISGAPVLLLDEVTSALDAATEQAVLERICALPGKTCIAVTHRPAALELADHVIEVTEHSMTLRNCGVS